jgi:hypothetical protein
MVADHILYLQHPHDQSHFTLVFIGGRGGAVFIIQNYWVLGICPSFCNLETRKQRFGNWICFFPQMRGKRHILS